MYQTSLECTINHLNSKMNTFATLLLCIQNVLFVLLSSTPSSLSSSPSPSVRFIGIASVNSEFQKEEISVMELAIELVHNRSDGWYDDITNIQFEYSIYKHECTTELGIEAVYNLSKWANTSGHRLDAVAGPDCSDSSKGAALVAGNEVFAVQLSSWSTNPDLTFAKYVYINTYSRQLLTTYHICIILPILVPVFRQDLYH